MTTDTSERGLEQLICTALGGAGWICGRPDDYDREYCLDIGHLLAFLVETQPEAFDGPQLEEDGPVRRKFLARLQGQISKRGTIDVLRHGLKHGPHHIDLFYGTPWPGNAEAAERHAATLPGHSSVWRGVHWPNRRGVRRLQSHRPQEDGGRIPGVKAKNHRLISRCARRPRRRTAAEP